MGTASDEIIARGRAIAGHVLEAAEADISFDDGRFIVTGTDRSVGLFEVASVAEEDTSLPTELQGALGAICDEIIRVPAYPFGCHVCEVEIDVDTCLFFQRRGEFVIKVAPAYRHAEQGVFRGALGERGQHAGRRGTGYAILRTTVENPHAELLDSELSRACGAG